MLLRNIIASILLLAASVSFAQSPVGGGISPPPGVPTNQSQQVYAFGPGLNGAACNDSTDDTGAFNSLLSTVNTAGGGTIAVQGTCLILGAVVFPNNGGSVPTQASIRITGLGMSANGGWLVPTTPPSALDLQYTATLGSLAIAGTAGQFTCSGCTNLAVGQQITISGANSGTGSITGYPTIASVAIAGTAGQFTCTCANVAVGQQLTLSGAFGGTGSITGYSNPTTYYVSATNGTSTFTLQTLQQTALTTTSGTPSGLTYTLNGTTYYVSATNGSSTFTLQSFGQAALTTTAGTPTGLTYKLQVNKLDTRGESTLEIDHLGLIDNGTDCSTFIQTTTTTLHIHDVMFHGTASKSNACNTAISLGGSGGATSGTVSGLSTSPFQGYGTVIRDNFFDQMSTIVSFNTYANSLQVVDNTISQDSGGGASASAFIFQGLAGANYLAGNLVETTYYGYTYNISHSLNNVFVGNMNWDGTAGGNTNVSGYFCGPGAGPQTIISAQENTNSTNPFGTCATLGGLMQANSSSSGNFNGPINATSLNINQAASTPPALGLYAAGVNDLGIASNSAGLMFVNPTNVVIGANGQIQASDIFGVRTATNATKGITIRNTGLGNATQTVLYLANSTSNTEGSFVLNDSTDSAGNGANSLTIGGAAGLWLQGGTTNGIVINASGQVTLPQLATATGSFVCGTASTVLSIEATTCVASDERLKNDKGELTPQMALARVMALPLGHDFTFKEGYGAAGIQEGFFAQEVKKTRPDLVTKSAPTALTPDGTLSVNYPALGIEASLAVKALQSEIDTQRMWLITLSLIVLALGGSQVMLWRRRA